MAHIKCIYEGHFCSELNGKACDTIDKWEAKICESAQLVQSIGAFPFVECENAIFEKCEFETTVQNYEVCGSGRSKYLRCKGKLYTRIWYLEIDGRIIVDIKGEKLNE